MGMGLRFEQESHCNDGICAVAHWDLVKIWAGDGSPSEPSLNVRPDVFAYFLFS
jgi:hypothetical protein